MNDWICARSAAMRLTALACCMARSVRMRTNSSKPPGVSEIFPRSRNAIASTARSSRPRSCETSSAAPGKRASQRLQPERRLQVEVVGRFVEQQQVGVGEQRGRQRHAHAPAAGEFLHRARLRGFVEAQAGEDGGGAGRGRIGADRAQAFVDLGQAVRFGGIRLGQQRKTFGVALQHGIEQRGVAGGRFLRHGRDARARSEADVAAVQREFAHDRAQQGGLAGAVAPDQADAAAGIDREVGAVEDGAPAEADGGAGDDEKGHGGE